MMAPLNWETLLADSAMSLDELSKRCGVSTPTMKDWIDKAISSGILEERYHPDKGVRFYGLKENEK